MNNIPYLLRKGNILNESNDIGIIDKWIMNKFSEYVNQVNTHLKTYNLHGVVGKFKNFMEIFCNWYIRLNRKFIRGFGDLQQWNNSLYTLIYYSL
jgi:isoleucyl-tRNA synthetase